MSTLGTQQWQCLNCKEVFPDWDLLPLHICGNSEDTKNGTRGPFLVLPKQEFSAHHEEVVVETDPLEVGTSEHFETQPKYPGLQNSIWSHNAVNILLEAYNQNKPTKDEANRKIDGWRKIAEIMNQKGYNYSGDNCDGKLRSLKQRFKKILLGNAARGRPQFSSWPYFKTMMRIFESDAAFMNSVMGKDFAHEFIPQKSISPSNYPTKNEFSNPTSTTCSPIITSPSIIVQPVHTSLSAALDEDDDREFTASPPTPESPFKTPQLKSTFQPHVDVGQTTFRPYDEEQRNKRVRDDDEMDILDFIQKQSSRMDDVVKVASERNTTLQKLMAQILAQQQTFLQSQQELQRQQQQMMVQLQQQQLNMMQLLQQQFHVQFKLQNKASSKKQKL